MVGAHSITENEAMRTFFLFFFKKQPKISTVESGCEYSEPCWIRLHSAGFHTWKPSAKIFSPCLHTTHSPFTTHQAFYFSSPSPSFFWFSWGRSEAGLSLRNLISWVNAKKWLCSIRGSRVFRTIAVVQRAGNLANTNMISSACSGVLDRMLKLCDCCSSENPSGEKIQHRVASLQLPLIWQIRGPNTSRQHPVYMTAEKLETRKKRDIYNWGAKHLLGHDSLA